MQPRNIPPHFLREHLPPATDPILRIAQSVDCQQKWLRWVGRVLSRNNHWISLTYRLPRHFKLLHESELLNIDFEECDQDLEKFLRKLWNHSIDETLESRLLDRLSQPESIAKKYVRSTLVPAALTLIIEDLRQTQSEVARRDQFPPATNITWRRGSAFNRAPAHTRTTRFHPPNSTESPALRSAQ